MLVGLAAFYSFCGLYCVCVDPSDSVLQLEGLGLLVVAILIAKEFRIEQQSRKKDRELD